MPELDPLLLSRIQFAFTVSFHILFPSFTIGLAAWILVLDLLFLRTGKAIYAEFGCAACHRIHGTGGVIGPDLSFVGDARPERSWHIAHFKDPQSVSPGSIMPKFPLTDPPLDDLAGYMLSLRKSS